MTVSVIIFIIYVYLGMLGWRLRGQKLWRVHGFILLNFVMLWLCYSGPLWVAPQIALYSVCTSLGWFASFNPFEKKDINPGETWYANWLLWKYSHHVFWGNFSGLWLRGIVQSIIFALFVSPWCLLAAFWLPISYTYAFSSFGKRFCIPAFHEWLFGILFHLTILAILILTRSIL